MVRQNPLDLVACFHPYTQPSPSARSWATVIHSVTLGTLLLCPPILHLFSNNEKNAFNLLTSPFVHNPFMLLLHFIAAFVQHRAPFRPLLVNNQPPQMSQSCLKV